MLQRRFSPFAQAVIFCLPVRIRWLAIAMTAQLWLCGTDDAWRSRTQHYRISVLLVPLATEQRSGRWSRATKQVSGQSAVTMNGPGRFGCQIGCQTTEEGHHGAASSDLTPVLRVCTEATPDTYGSTWLSHVQKLMQVGLSTTPLCSAALPVQASGIEVYSRSAHQHGRKVLDIWSQRLPEFHRQWCERLPVEHCPSLDDLRISLF